MYVIDTYAYVQYIYNCMKFQNLQNKLCMFAYSRNYVQMAMLRLFCGYPNIHETGVASLATFNKAS